MLIKNLFDLIIAPVGEIVYNPFDQKYQIFAQLILFVVWTQLYDVRIFYKWQGADADKCSRKCSRYYEHGQIECDL